MSYEKVREHYLENREKIEDRLKDFEDLKKEEDYRIFMELVFVILTSQTSARDAWSAVEELDRENILMEGDERQVAEILREHGVSYEDNKASYIIENRNKLSQPTLSNPTNELKLKEKIDPENTEKTREWLVENMKGMGWKGASHFMRNIGYGDSFAIISSHIISQLKELGVEKASRPENKEEYLEMERKLQKIAEKAGIEIKALDLVLWSMKTGEVFK